MYHSITFWDGSSVYSKNDAIAAGDEALAGSPKGYNTWLNWHLIPTQKPSIAIPSPETNTLDIEGRSGSVDLTDKIYFGDIVFGNRTGSLEFYIDHEREDWVAVRAKISSSLHGKTFKMVLEDDPEYCYEGRFTLKALEAGESYSQLTINYQLQPYRYHFIIRTSQSGADIIWDTFNFETDYDWSVEISGQAIISSEGVL